MPHPSPQPQRAGNEDTVWWQQQLVKLSVSRESSFWQAPQGQRLGEGKGRVGVWLLGRASRTQGASF